MKQLKVVTVVGTRPEIIRLAALIPKLDELTSHVLVHTGQNNDKNLNDVFFQDLNLRPPNHFLDVDTSSMGSVMGDTIRRCEEIFLQEKPDAVMILGDTNSAIAAVVAERMHIPVYHMEAGNRSFDANVPEELNRKLVDHVATFNLPYNSYSKKNLEREGIHPRFIHLTGSPLREILTLFAEPTDNSSVLDELGLKHGNYLLASFHRQENVDDPNRLKALLGSLSHLADHYKMPVVISTHPRTRKRLASLHTEADPRLQLHEPFGYFDYVKLQKNAWCVLSDSGTISEEATILGFAAVSIRDSFERPESFSSGITLAGVEPHSIQEAVAYATQIVTSSSSLPEGYESNNFSDSVVAFLLSTARRANSWLGRTPQAWLR